MRHDRMPRRGQVIEARVHPCPKCRQTFLTTEALIQHYLASHAEPRRG